MATINDITELLAWGATPSWVENQFENKYKSGTKTVSKSDGWGGKKSYTYTLYGLSSISTGSGSFDSSDWNSWDSSTQGSKGNSTYTSGGYGIELDDGSLNFTQPVADLTFGTAVVDVETDQATAGPDATTVSVIDNTDGSTDLTQEVSFTASQEVSSGTTTSNGWSNTTEVSVGTEVSAEFAGIGASVNASVTNATTIDSSTTKETTQTDSVSTTLTNTVTVPVGYKIQLTMLYQNQHISIPYTFPVTASGTSKYSDKWGNSWSVGVGDNINSSIEYGAPNAAYMSASSSTDGTLVATGTLTNVNASNFTTQQTTLVTPTSASSRSGKAKPHTELPAVTIDGEKVKVGVHYDLDDIKAARGARLIGSKNSDTIRMGAKGQSVYTFGGNDIVYGSKFADVINSRGDDKISSGKGDDVITSTTGSTDIDAGEGNDKVNITSKGGGFDDVTLGKGKDKVNINLTKGEDYSFVIRDLGKKEHVDITSDKTVTSKVFGNTVEVHHDGDYVGSIAGYVDNFDSLSLIDGAKLGLMNMDKIGVTASTATTAHWKNDLIAYGALNGWGGITKNYRKFVRTNSDFKKNSEALSQYMYDGKVVDEFVDAMTSVIGDRGINDMVDHVTKAISELPKDLQDYFKPDTLI